jgi:trans-AT polyketide synthase, acyltransferase and oxidoreductase domains
LGQREPTTIGWWRPGTSGRLSRDLIGALQTLDRVFFVVQTDTGLHAATGGEARLDPVALPDGYPLIAHIPAQTPDMLGDRSFQTTYGVRANYVAGAMANGIGSAELVIAMARAGMLGFFGAAGLATEQIRQAIDRIQRAAGDLPYGFNLIHSPAEPHQEQETVDLYLERGVHTVSTSAYLGLTPMVVQYRVRGMRRGADGTIVVPNRLLAKISRPEVAEKFLRPPPEKILSALVQSGRITAAEAALAAQVPMADDLTAEADSGGHTDNRPLPVLLPLIRALRDRIAPGVRVGAAGGLGTPDAVASAFALGAAYVVTGTINQACVEAGTSSMVKALLADAGMADVGMAPASDMFEAGVDVQVLKRGTLFAMRGQQLYALYRDHDSLDDIPPDVLKKVETQILRCSVADVWTSCTAFFADRDPSQLERAARDPRHKMALVFRWYLGLSSRWAIGGEEARKMDCQIWCGPCIGSFNDWTAGTFLAAPENRSVVVVAANLMAGAAAVTRANTLRQSGVDGGPTALRWTPRPLRQHGTEPFASREPHVQP